jgi:hypothetical protein
MEPRPPSWARTRILTHLLASLAGQILIIYPGGHLLGSAVLALNGVYFVLFFRSVRAANRLEAVLLESGDLTDEEEDGDDEVVPMGTSYPWIFLGFPIVYVASLFDAELAAIVPYLLWLDLVRLAVQFLLMAMVHANLHHRLRMLTDHDYLMKIVDAAKRREEKAP